MASIEDVWLQVKRFIREFYLSFMQIFCDS